MEAEKKVTKVHHLALAPVGPDQVLLTTDLVQPEIILAPAAISLAPTKIGLAPAEISLAPAEISLAQV